MMRTPRSWLARWFGVLVGPLGAVHIGGACGGRVDAAGYSEPPGTPSPSTAAPSSTAENLPEPTEFRVAYINLLSPITLDATNTTASDTFDDRLQLVIDQLKQFKPDLVAFSEVTDTKEHGSVLNKLASALQMEPLYVRAKPWFVGQSKAQNDQVVKLVGFEEGELILVNGSRFAPVDGDKIWLNPRTSESEGPAGLWMKLKGPASVGDIDVFVSHLTGVDPKVRAQQAADFARFIKSKKGSGPSIVLGDFGDPAGTPTEQAFLDIGLTDLMAQSPITTCCRDSLVGEQPALSLRTDYIFASQWMPGALGTFAFEPKKREDGTLIYASDHNGITAVFPVPPPATP
jgi:hypothetical protein